MADIASSEDHLPMAVHPNSVFTFAAPRRQRFSIPLSIIYYLVMNPTSHRAWKKLVQACKYFYSKHPVIIVDSLTRTTDMDFEQPTMWVVRGYGEAQEIDLANVPYKFWIINRLSAMSETQDLVSLVYQKLYRLDLYYLNIQNETILFDDLCFLNSMNLIQDVTFSNLVIKNNDGSVTEFDKVLELFPRMTEFYFKFSPSMPCISPAATTKCMELPPFVNLKNFELDDISEDFDIETFSIFMKETPVSPEYTQRLHKFVDTLLKEGKNFGATVIINFQGLEPERAEAIENLMFNDLNYSD